jgi:inosine-uridine nucleoside N-ribohydrolase
VVGEHPGEVSLVCGGPLTNVALAVRLDPESAHRARRLVLGLSVGGALSGHPASTRPNFNEMFDPEAARIVLTAGWREVVVIDTADAEPVLTAEMMHRIQEHPTAATSYLLENGKVGLPLWAQHVAVVADPGLAVGVEHLTARLDIQLDDQRADFGRTVIDEPRSYSGPPAGQAITWIYALDNARYVTRYVASLQSPRMGPRPAAPAGRGEHSP